MLTIKRVEPTGTCVFCNKEKEVAAVMLDGQQTEVMLCWSDIKKHAQMRMRMNGKADSRPATVTPPGQLANVAK